MILAPGAARRYGQPKLLLPWRGEAIIRHVARAALSAGLDPVVVVTGEHQKSILDSLVGMNVALIINPDWEKGQSSSLQAGLRALPCAEIGSSVFLLVGLQREGGTLRVYLKGASNITESVFSAVNLITSVVDSTYTAAGRVGFVSYGAPARFFTVRAGGLTSSLSLEHADTTVATGHLHASGSAYTTPAGSASRATFNTETVTLTELAHAVKALIDDLQADHLIT